VGLLLVVVGKRKTSLNSREVIQRGRNREEAELVIVEACNSTLTFRSLSILFTDVKQIPRKSGGDAPSA
jgi:hypothetical protein